MARLSALAVSKVMIKSSFVVPLHGEVRGRGAFVGLVHLKVAARRYMSRTSGARPHEVVVDAPRARYAIIGNCAAVARSASRCRCSVRVYR